MSAAAKVKRPPRFTTYAEVDIDIEPEDLERAGWVYVGKGDETAATSDEVRDIVRRWHNEEHDTPWRWCEHTLCDRLRGRAAG